MNVKLIKSYTKRASLRRKPFRCVWLFMNIRIAFVWKCSGFVVPGIGAGLAGTEIPVTSVRDIVSVVSIMFIFVSNITESSFVWGWKTILAKWFDFLKLIFSMVVDWIERISSKLWLLAQFADIARVIKKEINSNWEIISELT